MQGLKVEPSSLSQDLSGQQNIAWAKGRTVHNVCSATIGAVRFVGASVGAVFPIVSSVDVRALVIPFQCYTTAGNVAADI